MEDPNIMTWNDTLENDGQEYILLPEGDYPFTVAKVERGQYPGGPKVPACPKATLTLEVETEQGTATVRTDLLLYRTLEWKLASFFRSIGQKKHGEKTVMDWNQVAGAGGRARFRLRSYTKGEITRQVNDVERFLDPPDDRLAEDPDDLPWYEGGY